ncbi:hypothetical protein N4P33_33085 [Streptomyces sp. 15-116A]|uniref:hypothetical protein n=1 Tax=Streptomyces sp. 15-116A TaxID=2259035 RepID=UPI0021B471E9|nr:hypothetical protein [Streptomyces sp. 15-116A]MCT7356941.1 hypothetical protein [Streptomyces sp. 15-116A]
MGAATLVWIGLTSTATALTVRARRIRALDAERARAKEEAEGSEHSPRIGSPRGGSPEPESKGSAGDQAQGPRSWRRWFSRKTETADGDRTAAQPERPSPLFDPDHLDDLYLPFGQAPDSAPRTRDTTADDPYDFLPTDPEPRLTAPPAAPLRETTPPPPTSPPGAPDEDPDPPQASHDS